MKEIRMIKLLQGSVIAIFVLIVITGVVVFIIAPQKLKELKELVDIVFPFFMAELVPAIIGTPLKNAVEALKSKKES